MTPCEQVQLSLDGRLAPSSKAEVDAHLASCAQCRALVEAWQRFDGGLAALEAPAPAEVRRLMSKAEAATRFPPRPVLAFGALVVIVAAVLFAVARGKAAPQVVALPEQLQLVLEDEGGVRGDLIEVDHRVRGHLGDDVLGLAPGTKVRVLRRDRREVRLKLEAGAIAVVASHRAAGEAFIVEAGGLQVTVIGTRFRVALNDGAPSVEVLDGRVRVTEAAAVAEVGAGEMLRAGEAKASALERASFVELEDEPLDDEPLDEVDSGAGPLRSTAPKANDLERWRRAALAGHCANTVAEIRAALGPDHGNAAAWRITGDCLRLDGHDAGAAAAYRKVIRLGAVSEADRARLLLADLLLKNGSDAGEVEKVMRAFLAHAQPQLLEGAARLKLARAQLQRGDAKQAREELRRVIGRAPGSPAAAEAQQLLDGMERR